MPDGGNGSVHQALGSFINLLCGERDKGGTAPPLSIPAAPRGNRCCALRSPPACLTAAGSTRHPVSVRLCPPSMASRPCHSRFGSPISAGTQPLAVKSELKTKSVSLKARFGRPDKRTRHPAYHRGPIAGWRLRLIRPTRFQRMWFCRPDKRQRHPAICEELTPLSAAPDAHQYSARSGSPSGASNPPAPGHRRSY